MLPLVFTFNFLLSYFLVMQNVSPAHTPDIVVYIDAITIVFEETSKGGQPLSLPIACIEAGTDQSLPNLALRYQVVVNSRYLNLLFRFVSPCNLLRQIVEKTPKAFFGVRCTLRALSLVGCCCF